MSKKFMQTSYKIKSSQKINVTSTAAVLSSQLADHIETCRLTGDISFWVTNGSSTVTASSTGASDSFFVPAGNTEYINTQNRYFSVIADSSSGFAAISEVTQ